MQFNNLDALFKHVKNAANNALKVEVAKTAVETMKEHVEKDVYEKYSPKQYTNTYGLLNDIDVEVINDQTISIENTRTSPSGKDIAAVIESGVGYDYTSDKGYNTYDDLGRTYERPRPFIANTRQELKVTGKVKNAMINGLKRQNIDVK